MTDRTKFLIPEANMARFEREVMKLSKKAEKFGGWSIRPIIFGIQMRDNGNGTQTKLFEVNLDVPEIKLGDWTFVARIDHSQETGNIVRTVPDAPVAVEQRFRKTAPDCEHCNHKRKRRDTFVLFNNENGEMKQVGSTCLKDFLGHDAADLGRVAEFASYANEFARACEREEGTELIDHRYITLSTYLTHCAAMVRTKGWISGKAAWENQNLTSTRAAALENMRMGDVELIDEDAAMAEKALEWAQEFETKDMLSDYEHNVLVIANSLVIEGRACGLAASIVGVYATKHTPRPKSVTLDNMAALIALFETAGSRLKNPKIIVFLPSVGEVELTMAKATHKVPGSINVKQAHGGWEAPWYGRILRDGTFTPSSRAPVGLDTDLLALASDPAGVVGSHGHKTGRCFACNLPLTDATSLHFGYGATCAKNWNLPYGKKAIAA